ncbi:hypothetical protein [Streptomyces sp. NBC_01006]|nr:hypothetical protein OG509_01430 [Streptomyces sp. NBC_01006]
MASCHGRACSPPFSDAPPVEYGFFWSKAGKSARIRAFVDADHELC